MFAMMREKCGMNSNKNWRKGTLVGWGVPQPSIDKVGAKFPPAAYQDQDALGVSGAVLAFAYCFRELQVRDHILCRQFEMFALLLLFLPSTFGAIQTYPPNPCPNVFSYVLASGRIAGHVVVPNDLTENYELTLNMSLARYLAGNQNIRIQMLSSVEDMTSGKPIQYLVVFPVQDVLPRLTEVTINGRVICTGPPEQLLPGRSVTSMWAKSFFRTNIIPPGIFEFTPVQTPVITPAVTTPSPSKEVKCGIIKSSQNLILGGEATGVDEFPWLTAIMYTDGTNYKLKCTGNLISDRHVITAGHCLRYYKAPLIENENIVVVLGKNDIKNWPLGITSGVAKVLVHPNYTQDNPVSDLVILVLDKPITPSPRASPICLWEGDDQLSRIVGRNGTLVGWGADKIGAEFSPLPNKIKMPLVSQEQCLWSHRVFRNLTSGNTFCAGNRDGTGPCAGDAGAGFILENEATSRWFLRGVAAVSLTDDFNHSCDLYNYIVFADVAKEMPWIKSVVN